MIKRDEIEYSESCLNKARDDERMFILLARDPASPVAIRAWVAERIRLGKNAAGDDQVVEALDCATRMEEERAADHHRARLPFPEHKDVHCCPAHLRSDGHHSADCPRRETLQHVEAP